MTMLTVALVTCGVLTFSGAADDNTDEISKLRVSVPSSVLMYEPFDVHVTDLWGNPVAGADVTFFIHYPDDIPYYSESKLTNTGGTVWFIAPPVPHTLTGYVEVFKEGLGFAGCYPITIINPYTPLFDHVV